MLKEPERTSPNHIGLVNSENKPMPIKDVAIFQGIRDSS